MKNIETYNTFDSIKHIDKNGVEFWDARELQKVLEYKQWRRFENVINKAKESCRNSNYNSYRTICQRWQVVISCE